MTTQTETTRRPAPRRRRRERGMTLIEIMVVITILGLIAAAVGVAVIPKLGEAKTQTARTDIHAVKQALDLYKVRKGKYPDTATGLKALVDTQNLERMPKDPWGNDYVYTLEGGKPTIVSYGADGQAGGEGEDADVSSRDAESQEKQ